MDNGYNAIGSSVTMRKGCDRQCTREFQLTSGHQSSLSPCQGTVGTVSTNCGLKQGGYGRYAHISSASRLSQASMCTTGRTVKRCHRQTFEPTSIGHGCA
eukprot:2072748-Amphidinium_carterae.1